MSVDCRAGMLVAAAAEAACISSIDVAQSKVTHCRHAAHAHPALAVAAPAIPNSNYQGKCGLAGAAGIVHSVIVVAAVLARAHTYKNLCHVYLILELVFFKQLVHDPCSSLFVVLGKPLVITLGHYHINSNPNLAA